MAKMKKAQGGEYITKDKKGVITNLQKLQTKSGPRYYQSSGNDWSITDKINSFKARTESKDSIPSSSLNKRQLEVLNQKKTGGKIKKAKNGAWQRKEGKNPAGGLNAKGRASYNRETGGHLKAPQPEGGPRKRSFCARMSGVKGPAKKPDGSPTRKTLALRKWKC